jgi:tetratricopeptide (TPR) repeat protein
LLIILIPGVICLENIAALAVERAKPGSNPGSNPGMPHLPGSGDSHGDSTGQSGARDVPSQDIEKVLKAVEGYLSEGSFSRAERVLSSALKEHPGDFRLSLEEAHVLRSMGNFARAKSLFLKLHAQQPAAVGPLIDLSQMSLESLAIDDSLTYARDAIAVDPSSKSANFALAAALIYNNSLSQANSKITDIEHKFGSSAELCYLRYQMFLREDKIDQALASLEGAVRLSPNNSLWLMDFSTLYKQEGNYNASLEMINRYLRLNPGSVEALSKVAALYEYNFHDYDRAILAYKQILQIDPDIVDAEVGIDRCRQKGNDIAAALKDQLWKYLRQSKTFSDVEKPSSYRNSTVH